MANYVSGSSDKSKNTALKCCIFGGWFGCHQYYVGKIGKGIFYTITLGGLGIFWIIDIFRVLLGSFRDNVGAPLRN
jgi:restriction system protein